MPPLDFFIGQWSPLPTQPSGAILTGKNVILTGANSGIGLAAAHQLAALNPDNLILACRNLKTGASALEAVLKRCPTAKATVWELDLASFASVKTFAERVNNELGRVDVAILNAGPGRNAPMHRTEDGHEVTHQVNVLSTILLALLLAPALDKSPEPRLVFTSSEVHGWADPTLIANAVNEGRSILEASDNEALYEGEKRYFLSKLLLQLVVRRLIPAMPRVVITSVNPGLCATNLSREVQLKSLQDVIDMLPFLSILPFMRSAARGATIVISGMHAKESCEYWNIGLPTAAPSVFMAQMTGMKASKQYTDEVFWMCGEIAPGSTAILQQQ